jgi:hypothetical protein
MMSTKRWFGTVGATAALVLAGQATLPATPAGADVPVDDPDVAASAVAVPRDPGTWFVNVEDSIDPDNPYDAWCAGVQGSRDSEVDVVDQWCLTDGQGWVQWDIDLLGHNAAGTPLYQIRNPYTGYCLSLEEVESGAVVKPDNGKDAQQEPCEKQHDAVWWFSSDGHGNVLVRPYLKNSVGRYPCLEADDSDLVGAVQIQIWDCPTSQMREWRLRKAS